MSDKLIQEAKENYADAKEYVREQYERIREDFRFSNPSRPEQWSADAMSGRKGRPTHTLDRTNKYIQHVVNKLREAKTSADILPADSGAHTEVAERLKGIIRHIEYSSKADIAWDTATDHAARGGLGWVRILPKLVHTETNEQELVISRIHDPTSCMLEAGWTSADGSDAMHGFIETTLSDSQFKRVYPNAKKDSFDTEGWFAENATRICEYFYVKEKGLNKVVITGPDGNDLHLTADEYTKKSGELGYEPPIIRDYKASRREVKWCTLSGCEVLEETIFPSQWIGLVPVIGHELWVDGKRYLCGLVRRLMDGQRLHNVEMSALTEALMIQPKAPYMVPARAIDENNQDQWANLNQGSPAFLTYNDIDDAGQPINAPTRIAPPNFPTAYANAANLAVQEMEEAVGMPRSTFGQQSNAVSGRAKLADQTAGETATFHFADNRRIAQEQIYRIAVDMIPTVYQNQQQAKILGEDGKQSSVAINPEMKSPLKRSNGKVVAINPGVGTYGVRVKIGPSYSTIREELGVKLQELGKGNPALAAAMTPMLLELSDMPEEAKRITRVVMAMLPPEVQKAYEDPENSDIPPQAQATIDQQGQQIQKMAGAMDQAHNVIKDLQQQVNDKSTAVQAEVKAAIAEISTHKKDLEAKAKDIDVKEKFLVKEARIAQLELDLRTAQALEKIEDEKEKASTDLQSQAEGNKAENDGNMALTAMAKAITEGQKTVAKALEQNTKALAQMQSMTVEALEDLADAAGATRQISMKRSDGSTITATSVAVMPVEAPVQ
jgi:hypothetical protein